jgi:hypothetical protein
VCEHQALELYIGLTAPHTLRKIQDQEILKQLIESNLLRLKRVPYERRCIMVRKTHRNIAWEMEE